MYYFSSMKNTKKDNESDLHVDAITSISWKFYIILHDISLLATPKYSEAKAEKKYPGPFSVPNFYVLLCEREKHKKKTMHASIYGRHFAKNTKKHGR